MITSMTEGKPWKLILSFTLPVIAGNIFQQFYNIMDSMIVGRLLGVNALAAVGSTGGLMFLSNGIVMGLTSGFGILIAQHFGAGNQEELHRYTGQSFLLSILIGILMTAGLTLANYPILRLMNTPEEIIDQTGAYIGVIYGGLLASFLYNMLASLARALGDSRTPLYFLIVSSVLNIVLDITLIAVVGYGVEGAAIATVISQGVSAALCFLYVRKKYSFLRLTREDMKFSKNRAGKLMKLGIPMALQFSITAFGVLIVQSFLNLLGPVYIAAYSAAGKISNVVTQVFPALGIATATFVGQNKGAARMDRVKLGVRTVELMVFLFSIVCGALVLLFGDSAARLFVTENLEEVLPAARQYLHITIWFYPFLGTIFVYRNALQGLGFGLVPMLGGIFELVARGAAAWFLARPFGYTGVCFGDPCAWVSALIPLLPVYFYYMKNTRAKE